MVQVTVFEMKTSNYRESLGNKLMARFKMLKADNLLMIAASLLLVAVNWLAFHDFLEAHTVRDWLMLYASVLVFIQFAREFWKRNLGDR